MTANDKIRTKIHDNAEEVGFRSGVSPIPCLSDISLDAAPHDAFGLSVRIEDVAERETKNGDPYYFVNVRDGESVRFAIIVWQWQWARFGALLVDGAEVVVNVRLPVKGYSAFSLVGSVARS
jgi:hypothetical protein